MKNYMFWIEFLVALVLILLIWYLPNYSLYDYLKEKQLDYYRSDQEKGAAVNCKTCRGTGEIDQDVNLLMSQGLFSVWYNIHLNSNKCKTCLKNNFCEIAQKKYDEIMSKYKELGSKIEKAACPDCMGMGSYTQYKGYRFGREK